MSIQTNPFKAVPLLLRRLAAIENDPSLDDLKSELVKIKDLFYIVKRNEEELLDTLTIVDSYIRSFNIPKLMEEKEDICKRIRNSTQKLLPTFSLHQLIKRPHLRRRGLHFVKPDESENLLEPLSPRPLWNLDRLKASSDKLDFISKSCVSLFSLFPENAVIKKRHAIYWCTGVYCYELGEGEDGVHEFNELLINEIIVPIDDVKHPFVNAFKINPSIPRNWWWQWRPEIASYFQIYSHIIASSQQHVEGNCLILDKYRVKLSDAGRFKSSFLRGIFNVGASYLNFGPQWIAKMKYLRVLHLGRWQDSTSHHIEVESEEFLNELGNLKYLRFLHLRGISRISKLPPSIVQLESLEFLDLKACHNLETLPNDIALLKNLKHFNVSKCYLLERMPKGIEKLTNLKVLKGFLIGSSSKTPCKISDLANLKELERLSIHIGSEAVIQDEEFESFGKLSKLKRLKISWGVSGTRYNDIQIGLPSNLEKLHLEGFPGEQFPKLSPSRLPKLTILYIMGGKLKTWDLEEYNNCQFAEVVRVKYLKHLKVGITYLRKVFPRLKIVET